MKSTRTKIALATSNSGIPFQYCRSSNFIATFLPFFLLFFLLQDTQKAWKWACLFFPQQLLLTRTLFWELGRYSSKLGCKDDCIVPVKLFLPQDGPWLVVPFTRGVDVNKRTVTTLAFSLLYGHLATIWTAVNFISFLLAKSEPKLRFGVLSACCRLFCYVSLANNQYNPLHFTYYKRRIGKTNCTSQ